MRHMQGVFYCRSQSCADTADAEDKVGCCWMGWFGRPPVRVKYGLARVFKRLVSSFLVRGLREEGNRVAPESWLCANRYPDESFI